MRFLGKIKMFSNAGGVPNYQKTKKQTKHTVEITKLKTIPALSSERPAPNFRLAQGPAHPAFNGKSRRSGSTALSFPWTSAHCFPEQGTMESSSQSVSSAKLNTDIRIPRPPRPVFPNLIPPPRVQQSHFLSSLARRAQPRGARLLSVIGPQLRVASKRSAFVSRGDRAPIRIDV